MGITAEVKLRLPPSFVLSDRIILRLSNQGFLQTIPKFNQVKSLAELYPRPPVFIHLIQEDGRLRTHTLKYLIYTLLTIIFIPDSILMIHIGGNYTNLLSAHKEYLFNRILNKISLINQL